MWQKIVAFFVECLNALKKPLISFALKAAGVSSGFVAWVVGLFAKKAIDKIEEEGMSKARIEDRKSDDKEVRDAYQEKIERKADEQELIESELDILNPRSDRRLR